MLRYDTYLKKNSLYNTPPAFGIYMVGKVVSWIKANGGLEAMAKKNAAKAKLVYDAIDNSDGFYVGHADKDSRSFMNVTFRLPSEELEAKFAKEALEHGLGGVKVIVLLVVCVHLFIMQCQWKVARLLLTLWKNSVKLINKFNKKSLVAKSNY